nr:BA14K family protein [Chelativorans sp. Marseille-P2723]
MMRKHIAMLCAAAMAFPVIAPAPAAAAPIHRAPSIAADNATHAIDVQYRERRHYRPHRAYPRHRHYRPHRHHAPRYRVYRRDNSAAALLGGLAAGAIIGGVLSSQSKAAPVHRADAHVQWCLSRYRSYDVRTDTFQPYNGPRRYCISPYR